MYHYLLKCQRHLEAVIAATSATGAAMWPSVINTRTGDCPRDGHVPQRVYRLIGAPQGSTLYWDQPMIVAAHRLSELTAEPRYAESAEGYVDAFLACCVADDGMFRWGNHAYFDIFRREVVEFQNGYHELRPITPAWELFWQRAPERLVAYIRTMAKRHLYDPDSGGFNRHDDGKKEHAFIESGGVLCETLAWLYAKTGDYQDLEMALRIARYSYSHRDPDTGLMPNEPDHGRWDSRVCTSEVGVWAQSLLRAADHSQAHEFIDMARCSVRAYLDHAYDVESGRYFGQVRIADGTPVVPEKTGYWPREVANFWNTDQWPMHDYPAAVAEASLTLYQLTADEAFLQDTRCLATMAVETAPARTASWAYAESYGRCIHLLARLGLALGDEQWMDAAKTLADDAMDRLWDPRKGLFQGYPDSQVYESVDGVGYLMLACMLVDTRETCNLQGFGF